MLVPIPNEDPGKQGSQCGPVPNGPEAAFRAKSGPIAVSRESVLVPPLTCNVNMPSCSVTMESADAATGNSSATNAMTKTMPRSVLSDALVACAMVSVLRHNYVALKDEGDESTRVQPLGFVNTPFSQRRQSDGIR